MNIQIPTVRIGDERQNKVHASINRRRSSRFANVSGISALYPTYKSSIKGGNKDTEEDTDISSITVIQAAREGLAKELDLLLQEYPSQVNTTDNSGLTPLHVACKSNSAKIADVLIRHKADLNMEIKPYHISPLHVAAKYNAVDVCRLLINGGANITSRDCKKKTPLHYAARRGHVDIATMLLQLGKCDVNVRDEDQLTSLHDAIMHKQSKIVPLLLKFGADIFTVDVNGTTAFHFAASEGMVNTMNLLLQHGQ